MLMQYGEKNPSGTVDVGGGGGVEFVQFFGNVH